MLIDKNHPQSRRARVFIDGLDVTRQVIAANDEEGWADVILLKPHLGPALRFQTELGKPKVRRMTGEVAIVLPALIKKV